MAKATKKVTEETVVVEKVSGYTLELTVDEARALMAVTGNISGTSELRNLTSSVYYALSFAGVNARLKSRGKVNVTSFSDENLVITDRDTRY